MLPRRQMSLLMVGLLLVGWLVSAPAGVAQEKGDPEAKEGELAAPEKLGKLTLTLDPGWHTGLLRRFFFTPDGKQVISLADDHAIRIWDAASGEMHKVLYPPGHGGLFQADLSADGKRLAVASRYSEGDKLSHVIYILALPEGRIERVLKGHTKEITVLAISRDGKLVASGGKRAATWIWNLDKEEPGRVLRKLSFTNFGLAGLAFSPDGTRLACSGDNGAIIDGATGKELAKLKGYPVAWSPDGKTLATAVHSEIWLLDADGKQIRAFPRKVSVPSLAFSGDSRTLLAGHVLFDVATGAELSKSYADKWTDGNRAVNALTPDGRFAVTGGEHAFVWKTEDGAILKKLEAPRWMPHGAGQAAWSPDGMAISSSNSPKKPSFHLGDLRFGPPLTDKRGAILRQAPWTIEPVPSGGYRVLKDGKQTYFARVFGPRTLFGKDQVVAGGSGTLELLDAQSGKAVRQFDKGRSEISSIAPSPDGRFFLTTSHDASQRLRIWNPEQEKPLLNMYCQGSDWILWTPEGYYAATPGGERLMGWVADNGIGQMATFYPAERFRKQMYRPDVIKLLLVKGNLKNALAAANAARGVETRGVTVAELVPPRARMTVIDQSKLPIVKLKVQAEASAKEQPITSLRLMMDGRVVPGKETLAEFKDGKAKAEIEWSFELPEGEHQLAVLARCPDSSAVSAPLRLKHVELAKLPTLHVLTIGINNYKDAALDLKYAAPDAEALATAFAKNCKEPGSGGRGAFRDVKTKTLLNQQATAKNIAAELAELRKSVAQQDLAIVFFACHGVKQKKEYFLLTHEADTADLDKTCLSGDALRKTLAEYKCQVLLMLDACHSAGFGEGKKLSKLGLKPATDDVVRDLTEDDYGVAVMCAAMGHEKAEGKGGHGLFTQALLEALEKKPGVPVPFNRHNQRVYIHHLQAFIFDEVSARSEERQHPFLSLPWVVESFVVR